ncbi:MAG: hypothetical protein QOK32_1725, partial [Gaiellaceae bacterium]|nr:hypothetical protein [Gaiellaceae bacterium]
MIVTAAVAARVPEAPLAVRGRREQC